MSNTTQILRSKADPAVHTIAPGAKVFEAAQMMAQFNIGALPVIADGKVRGIVSERNMARRLAVEGRSSRDASVAEIMDSQVCYANSDSSRERCMALMMEHRIRHLVILDGDRLAGLISIGDLVKDLISEQHFTIEQLNHYIAGDRG